MGFRPLLGLAAVAQAWCVAPTSALALDPSRAIDRYVHQAWTTDQGLPQNSIYAVVQTRDGYLWLGTDEGLVRFDGLRFTIFDRTNTPAITDPFIFSLHEGPDGSLWVGSDRGGLTRYYKGRFSHYGSDHGLPPGRIQAIASDAEGTVWVGMRGGGLARLTAGGHVDTFGFGDGLSSDNVLAVAVDRQGTVWVGTDAGLDRFERGRLVHATLDATTQRAVRAIYEDHSGRLWIGTIGGALGSRVREGALLVRHGGAFQVVSDEAHVPSLGVMAIREDRDGNLWLGTAGGGIVRFTTGRFESWLLGDTPSDDMVYALGEDREGSLWIGTQPGGLHRLQNSRFVTYEKRDGMNDEVIESLLQDRRGVMWIGTHAGGVCRLDRRDLSCLSTADGLAHNRVNAMLEDPDGAMWLGTEGGLNRLQGRHVDRYTTADGLPVDHVNALLRSGDGSLWIGTWGGGVARRRGNRIEQLSGATGRYVNTLHERRSGEIWIGTTDGVRIWTGSTLVDGTKDRGLPTAVEAFYEDRDGALWIGTRRDGLFLLHNHRLTQFTTRTGLYDNLVGTILEDDDGYLWMTCNKGIFRISRQALLEVAAGTRAVVPSRVFDTADGMKNRECDFGQGRWKAQDGRLWFATVGGVAVIDPARVAENSVPPHVLIEELDVDGDLVPLEPAPVLSHGKRHVEFRFAGLSLAAPGRVRYRYMLEGYDPGWIDGRDARTAHYTNLPPGPYRFHVTASNGDGVWSPEGAALAFAVANPLWRQPWFGLALGVFVFAGILAVGQVRMFRLQRAQAAQAAFARQLIATQEHERRRLAAELHDSIGQHLIIIKNWARLALAAGTPPDKAQSSLQVIAETATESIRDVRALTEGLQPYNIEYVGLCDALEKMLHRMEDASGIRFSADLDDVGDALTADARVNLFRIAQEAANNIVKHSRAAEAVVTLRRREQSIELHISDDGTGLPAHALDPSPRAGGFGLRSLEARTRLLGGVHHIASSPGRGTSITIDVPLRPST